MARIAKSAGDAAGVEQKLKRANDIAANSGAKVEKSLGAQRAAAQNLSFQLNGIATQLGSGTSPFRIPAHAARLVQNLDNLSALLWVVFDCHCVARKSFR
ncbi:hypothetical protein [Sinorhizobium sp. KGO-5]|uniref:hypothetical protein n=1 Tax=Sinorhizobium sp. KGO-5 TaxID=1470810 RepID=UPI0030C71D5A